MPPVSIVLNVVVPPTFELSVLLDLALWSLIESFAATLQVVLAIDRSLMRRAVTNLEPSLLAPLLLAWGPTGRAPRPRM